MRPPPIVQITVLYGAGLWAGLVVLVPSRGLLVILALAIVSFALRLTRTTLMAGAGKLPADAMAAVLLLGVTQGLVTARSRSGACAARWEPGPQAALVRINDRPSVRGLTTAV